MALPVVDVAALLDGRGDDPPTSSTTAAAAAIDAACRQMGFFLIDGHGIDPVLLAELEREARDFFAQPFAAKERVAMRRGGSSWRGWFPLGDELTSGVPDGKEGYYFGVDHAPDHPRVVAGTPLHGSNLFPVAPAGLGPAVVAWLEALRPVADGVLSGVALGLGLDRHWFARHLTADPTILFRIFTYPPGDRFEWGVQEHTDYGLLTLLAQDGNAGLQIRTDAGWIDVPPDRELLVCNLGDMLERLTEGRYRSTPHRVRNTSMTDRLSFPYFFDPSWDATVTPLPLDGSRPADDRTTRWDAASPRAWEGTYGAYLTTKVARVFPDLFGSIA